VVWEEVEVVEVQFAYMLRAILDGSDESPEERVVADRGYHEPRVAHLDCDDLISSPLRHINERIYEVGVGRIATNTDAIAYMDAAVVVESTIRIHISLPDHLLNL
jgi:hypothetical protein